MECKPMDCESKDEHQDLSQHQDKSEKPGLTTRSRARLVEEKRKSAGCNPEEAGWREKIIRNPALREAARKRLATILLVKTPIIKRVVSASALCEPEESVSTAEPEDTTDNEQMSTEIEKVIQPKRGPGRPIITGEHQANKEKRARINQIRREQEEREILGILEGNTDVPNPPETKSAQKWKDTEERKAEYFKSASTEETVTTVIDKMRGIYNLADKSRNLKGTVQEKIKTVATVIGAVAALQIKVSDTKSYEQMENLYRQIRRLKEENRRKQNTIEDIHARESIRTGEPLSNTLTGWEEEPKEQRKPHKTSLPPRGGEALCDGEMGDPSSPLPPIGGEPLGGNERQKTRPPPKGGGVLSLSTEERTKEKDQGEKKERTMPTKAKQAPSTKKKPVVKSNIIIAGPIAMSDEWMKQIQRLEQEISQMQQKISQMQQQVNEKSQMLNEIREGKIPLKGSGAQSKAQRPAKPVKKTPTADDTSTKMEEKQVSAGKSVPVSDKPGDTYATVVKKGKPKNVTNAPKIPKGAVSSKASQKIKEIPQGGKAKRHKPPKTAAVIITCQTDMTEVSKEARAKFDIKDLGIDKTKTRKAMNGGFMIEVAGDNKDEKQTCWPPNPRRQ